MVLSRLMPTMTIKIEIPEGFEKEFIEIFKDLFKRLETIVLFEMASKMTEKSELTEESALKIAKEIKRRIRERHDHY